VNPLGWLYVKTNLCSIQRHLTHKANDTFSTSFVIQRVGVSDENAMFVVVHVVGFARRPQRGVHVPGLATVPAVVALLLLVTSTWSQGVLVVIACVKLQYSLIA